ncbi:PAS domain S-box protein, partial [Candidatus Poribacteria bacterium]|nr:PAS domain S-box protein [Candidatus Poribacteria bacterium]
MIEDNIEKKSNQHQSSDNQNLSEYKQLENMLNHRIEFGKIISSISANFIKLKPEEIDNGLNQALKTIGKFSDVDRSYVFLFREDKIIADNTHEWCAKGIKPQIQKLKGVIIDRELPFFTKKLRDLDVLYVPNVDDLPEEAALDKEHFQLQNIQSLIAVPMVYEDSLIGFMGFDSVKKLRTWSEEDVELLKIVSDMFANAIKRKEMENQLYESEEKYRSLYSSMNEGLSLHEIVYDGKGNPVDYIILDVNPAYEKITGISRETAIGSLASELYGSEDPPYLEIYAEVISTGKSRQFEIYFPPLDKHFNISTFTPKPRHFATVFNDITEQKKIEKELRESRDFNSSLLENTPYPITVIDADKTITYVNPAFEKLTG